MADDSLILLFDQDAYNAKVEKGAETTDEVVEVSLKSWQYFNERIPKHMHSDCRLHVTVHNQARLVFTKMPWRLGTLSNFNAFSRSGMAHVSL